MNLTDEQITRRNERILPFIDLIRNIVRKRCLTLPWIDSVTMEADVLIYVLGALVHYDEKRMPVERYIVMTTIYAIGYFLNCQSQPKRKVQFHTESMNTMEEVYIFPSSVNLDDELYQQEIRVLMRQVSEGLTPSHRRELEHYLATGMNVPTRECQRAIKKQLHNRRFSKSDLI